MRLLNSFESFVKRTLNFLLGIPIVAILQMGACVILGFLFNESRKIATHQYTPVVQRIHIDSTNWCGGSLTITAAYDEQLDDSLKNDSAPGCQFLDFNAERIPTLTDSVIAPLEVSKLTKDRLSKYMTLSLSASGSDFKIDTPNFDKWFINTLLFPGVTRITELEKNHKFFFESYSNNAHYAKFLIRGNSIFTDTDPRNPYIAFNLTCKADVADGGLTFYYNVHQEGLKTIPYPSPIKLISVFPEPDYITPTEIGFSDSFDQILKHGLYFIAEDLSKTKDNQVRTFFNSVLMGIYISLFVQFFLGFLHNLSKWLNEREKRRQV